MRYTSQLGRDSNSALRASFSDDIRMNYVLTTANNSALRASSSGDIRFRV